MEIKLTSRQLAIISEIQAEKQEFYQKYAKLDKQLNEIVEIILDAKDIKRDDIIGLKLKDGILIVDKKISPEDYINELPNG